MTALTSESLSKATKLLNEVYVKLEKIQAFLQKELNVNDPVYYDQLDTSAHLLSINQVRRQIIKCESILAACPHLLHGIENCVEVGESDILTYLEKMGIIGAKDVQ